MNIFSMKKSSLNKNSDDRLSILLISLRNLLLLLNARNLALLRLRISAALHAHDCRLLTVATKLGCIAAWH